MMYRSVNAGWFRDPYMKRKYTLWAKCRIARCGTVGT